MIILMIQYNTNHSINIDNNSININNEDSKNSSEIKSKKN